MSLNKLNYVDQVTVIPASNLNDIQDAIIELEGDVGEIETEIEGKADADSVYTKTEADALLNAKADSSDVYTKTETDALLNAKANASETYTKTEVDTLVSGKADASDVYTKTEVDTALQSKADSSAVYTKTETDTLLSGKASASDLEALEEEMTDYRQMYLDSLIHTTASGAIASFSDGFKDAPMDFCTATIEPKQEGSGDPSPTNVRPISGWTGAEVVRCGLNVWDEQWEVGSINPSDGSLVNTQQIRSKNYIPILPNTSYCFHAGTERVSYAFWYDANQTFLSATQIASNNSVKSSPADAHYLKFQCPTAYGTTYKNDISINYPSTATAYEPYQADTYSVTWEDEAGTVYGGSVDIVSGVLTVDRAIVDLGTLDWSTYSTPANHIYRTDIGFPSGTPKVSASAELPYAICDTFYPMAYNPISSSDNGAFAIGNSRLVVIDHRFTSASDFKTAVNGVMLCYELATPITYQLTPQEITTLLGSNNVWSDTGAMACGYVANTKLYIDSKLS